MVLFDNNILQGEKLIQINGDNDQTGKKKKVVNDDVPLTLWIYQTKGFQKVKTTDSSHWDIINNTNLHFISLKLRHP